MIIILFYRSSGTQKSLCLGSFGRVLGSGAGTISGKRCTIRNYHEVTGDIICPSMVQGIDHLRDPRLNKVNFCI